MTLFMQNYRIRMRHTVFVLVCVLFVSGFCSPFAAGQSGSPSGPTRRVEDIEESEKPKGAFFASLKFWEKNKNRPAEGQGRSHTHSTSQAASAQPASSRVQMPVAAQSSTAPPASLLQGMNTANTADTANSVIQEPNTAPIPPQIPYYERTETNSKKSSNVESAGTYDPNFVQNPPFAPAVPAQPSMSSYAFDTRDWIEFFPVQNAANPYSASQVQTQPNAVPDPQTAPQRTAATNNWNGQTTTLPVNSPASPSGKFASANPTVIPENPKPQPNAVPDTTLNPALPVDLSPSYQKHLRYTELCGVVVVQANFPLTEIASILEEINLLQRDLNLYMGVPAPKEKIELCLFNSEESYIKFLREEFPKAPRDRRALYIKLDKKPGTLLVQKSGDFEIDLRHEMTHAIIHASIETMPIWLDEGLAKYFEVPLADRAEKNPYMKQIRWNTRFGAVPSLDRLTKLETIDEMGTKEYRDSWAWTHFLIHRSPQTHQLLAAYLQMLAKLEPAAHSQKVRIPSLKLYLNDVVKNQREAFREHFDGDE
jgi:hypothetical protein